jgi:hypothetical protein
VWSRQAGVLDSCCVFFCRFVCLVPFALMPSDGKARMLDQVNWTSLLVPSMCGKQIPSGRMIWSLLGDHCIGSRRTTRHGLFSGRSISVHTRSSSQWCRNYSRFFSCPSHAWNGRQFSIAWPTSMLRTNWRYAEERYVPLKVWCNAYMRWLCTFKVRQAVKIHFKGSGKRAEIQVGS